MVKSNFNIYEDEFQEVLYKLGHFLIFQSVLYIKTT